MHILTYLAFMVMVGGSHPIPIPQAPGETTSLPGLAGLLQPSGNQQDQQNTFAQLMQQMIQQQAAGQDQDNLNVQQQPQVTIEDIVEEDITPTIVIEETIIEDASVPEQIAQQIVIQDGTITHLGAGPYNGFLQSPHATGVPAFITAIKEDGSLISRTVVPMPVLPSASIVPIANPA